MQPMSLLSLHYCGFWKGVIMPVAVQNLIILNGVFRVIALFFAFALLHLTLRYYAFNINDTCRVLYVCMLFVFAKVLALVAFYSVLRKESLANE